ncbi:MAG TPA: hypothetical protein VFQ23_01380, partial [Anaerolineales bacterium]|nr:hypothetical protein [Anaerolineales bacterium]
MRRRKQVIYLYILLVFDIALVSCGPDVSAAPVEPEPQKPDITVTVTSESGGEISTGIARILGTPHAVTLQHNKFTLPFCSPGNYISMWSPGYYIKTVPCTNEQTYMLQLKKLEQDNINYLWASAQTCAGCHSQSQGRTEHLEWT